MKRKLMSWQWLAITWTLVVSCWLACLAHSFVLPVERRRHSPTSTRTSTRTTSTLWSKASKSKKKKPSSHTVAINRVAYRNYEILERYEAGVSFLGTEVKSIVEGKINIRDGFVKPTPNGRSCKLYNVHISKCSNVGADFFQHDETRVRDLLLHKHQSRQLLQKSVNPGITIVPLKLYWSQKNRRHLKFEIALCRGKNKGDKRQTIKERENKRETDRIVKSFRGSSL